MVNPEYITPVFQQVQERHDRIEALHPGTGLKELHDKRRAQLFSAIREIINPPKSRAVEIPIEPDVLQD